MSRYPILQLFPQRIYDKKTLLNYPEMLKQRNISHLLQLLYCGIFFCIIAITQIGPIQIGFLCGDKKIVY